MTTDPIVVAAQIITALQTTVFRNLIVINEAAVISITEFITNGTVNVIPSLVKIKGGTRSFTEQTLHKIEKAVECIVTGQCLSAGLSYKYQFKNSFIPTLNTPVETEYTVKATTKVVGADKVNGNCSPFTISEDFAFMLLNEIGAK